MSIIYVLLSLTLLYFSKRLLTLEFSRLIRRFGGSRHSLVIAWSVVFLPGTVVHELSHFFFAILTGARTGKIQVLPEYLESELRDESEGKHVALGYVQTQKLNPIQGFFVGNAPFLVGLIVMVWLSSLLQDSFASRDYTLIFLQGYLFFTVANSFFPSWTDIKQTLPFVIIIAVLGVVLWLVGVAVFIKPNAYIVGLLDTITTTISVSAVLNFLIVTTLYFLGKIFRRH